MKDRFSSLAHQYAQFRPHYPAEVYHFMREQVSAYTSAWDCGTGNGQVAIQLASFMEQVAATDISQNQLDAAAQHPTIQYSLQPAEQTNFPDNHFDLVTVAQAIHWFQFDAFYQELHRVLKPNGLFVVLGYGLLYINPAVDAVLYDFYENTIGAYWDPERQYIEQKYQSIPFPLEEIETPLVTLSLHWTLAHFLGYLKSWSAVKRYEETHGVNPVDMRHQDIAKAWGSSESLMAKFPILFRAGRLKQH